MECRLEIDPPLDQDLEVQIGTSGGKDAEDGPSIRHTPQGGERGENIRGVVQELGISRNTVGEYLKVPDTVRVEKEPRCWPVREKVAPRRVYANECHRAE